MTKALLGLFGSDRFRLAVSADGSTFFDGLIVDNTTGIVDQPQLPRFKAYTNYDNYVGVGTWTKIGLNVTDTKKQAAFDAANNRFVAPVDVPRGGAAGAWGDRPGDAAGRHPGFRAAVLPCPSGGRYRRRGDGDGDGDGVKEVLG